MKSLLDYMTTTGEVKVPIWDGQSTNTEPEYPVPETQEES